MAISQDEVTATAKELYAVLRLLSAKEIGDVIEHLRQTSAYAWNKKFNEAVERLSRYHKRQGG